MLIVSQEPLHCLASEPLVFARVVASRFLYTLNSIFKDGAHECFFRMRSAGIARGAMELLWENRRGGQQSAGAGEIIEE